jgi:hypothetical protein
MTALIFFIASTISKAQDKDKAKRDEYLQQQGQLQRAALMRELDSGVYFMDVGKYEIADQKFKYVLANLKSVPSDLTFYFGKNSFYLGKFKQSIDWLNKYIQLKGTNGQFSQEAIQIQKQAEEEVIKERAQSTQKIAEVFSTDYDIDCGPTGKVTCPVCKGDHVIIKHGAFGDQYKTCPYCDQHGILTCEEYNKLIRGQLKAKQ